MRRPGLLLTAAATVTVPGVLALLAVLGHDHAAAGLADASDAADPSSLAGQAGVSAWPSDPFPITPSATRGPVDGSLTPAQLALGANLLDQAAKASLATSYQGVEVISQAGVTGGLTLTSQVWHRGGGTTVMRTSTGARSAARVTVSYGNDRSPAGVFGLTSALVTLLGKHYVAAYLGSGNAAGRPAAVVNVYRFDGSLAARYWLDKQTMVPLRRELFDTTAKVIDEDNFSQVAFGRAAKQAAGRQVAGVRLTGVGAASSAASSSSAGSAASAGSSVNAKQAPATAWVSAPSPARFLAGLSTRGWRLPATLPGGLPLYSASWTASGGSQVADLEYSDGLYVVSLFVQRGSLGTGLVGWRQLSLDGQRVYVSGHSIAWAGTGLVYTMIADAPTATVAQDVKAVPDTSPPPGLLARLGRGLDRLAQLANPFG
jgi:sigma-E factor negative regulatory protein RseB